MSCLSCEYLGKTITPTTLYDIVSYYCKKTQKNISIENSIKCHHYKRNPILQI